MTVFNFLVETKVARICAAYSKKKNISADDALRVLLGSDTYSILSDPKTGVCYEVFECVYEMFLDEMGEAGAE